MKLHMLFCEIQCYTHASIVAYNRGMGITLYLIEQVMRIAISVIIWINIF